MSSALKTPNTPVEHTQDFNRARKAMLPDVEALAEMVLAQLNMRVADGDYEPALNRHFERPHEFMLDLLLEKLAEQR